MPLDHATATYRRRPDPRQDAANDPWRAAAAERPSESSGWLMSYLDVMTLLFSFFVVLFAYQKALTAKQAARAENVVQSAEAAAPFAKDHPGNAETTLPASSAVIKASKAVSSDTAAVPQPVRNAMETGPVAASEFKIYPAYPGSALALTGISRDSEDE